MCKIIATLTFLFVFSITLFGANVVPVVDLPAKPTRQLMSKLNNNAELFAEAIISYYTAAVCYEAQLKLMGVKPNRLLVAPSLQQLSTPTQRVLQTQWQQADALHKQVANLNVTMDNPTDAAFREQVFVLQTKLAEIRAENAELKFRVMELERFEALYERSLRTIEELRTQQNQHITPTLGVSVGVTTLLFSDDRISSNAGASVGLVFNPASLLGIGNFLDVWFDYSNLNIKTDHISDYGYFMETLTHNANILSVGANLVLPISKILEINKYYWNVKGGVGFYWLDDQVPNTLVENNLWKGMTFKVETEFINLASRFPFGIYASATFNRTNSNLSLNHPNYYYNSNIDFGKKWFNSLNAGFRFYLTGSN